MCWRRSIRNRQLTVSKALDMSIFRRAANFFFWCRIFVVNWTALKFSWIKCPRVNALWFGCTKRPIWGANLHASTFVNSLAKLWMRLIGLKSPTESAPFFFFSNTIKAWFTRYKLLPSRDQRAWKALIMSAFDDRPSRPIKQSSESIGAGGFVDRYF